MFCDLLSLVCEFPADLSSRPRGLMSGSAADRFLGFRVRILRSYWSLSLVIVVCCQVEVSASGWSLVQRSLTECGVCLSVIVKLWYWGGSGPLGGGGLAPWEKNVYYSQTQQTLIKSISECYVFPSYRSSSGNKIHYLNYKGMCLEMFRNSQHLTDFYKLFSNWRSIKLYIYKILLIYTSFFS